MQIDEAIKTLKGMNTRKDGKTTEALDLAIQALEEKSHLIDRPCDACEFHKENNCSNWECVFLERSEDGEVIKRNESK